MEVYIVYMELLLGHEKIITKSGISLNAGTLNRGFTVLFVRPGLTVKISILPTESSNVVCMDLGRNSHYFALRI
jgi:hypothetical protein